MAGAYLGEGRAELHSTMGQDIRSSTQARAGSDSIY